MPRRRMLHHPFCLALALPRKISFPCYHVRMDSLKGKLLLAVPAMEDPNFARSVVLIIKHDAEGAFGLVLNQPTGANVRDAIGLEGDLGEGEAALFRGGPCEGPLMVLHECAELAQETIIAEGQEAEDQTGVYFSVESELVRDLLRLTDIHTRYFHGYSGWAPGQLEAEMIAGGWLTIDASPRTIFDSDVGTHAWTARLKERTREQLKGQMNPNLIPPDPSVN